MTTLKELCSCGHPWAERRAKQALALEAAYQAQEITQDEYQELLKDLVRTDRLESEADDIHLRTLLVTCVYALTKVL